MMRVAKWGSSLAVRVPANVVRTLDIKEGDEVHLYALADDQIAVVTERQRRAAAIERICELAMTLPPGFKFDRDEANAR